MIKKFNEFNESLADIFKSAHGAIDRKNLQPLKRLIGKKNFPTQEEFDAAVEMTKADPDYFFYNPGDMLNPIIYWKGPMYYGFFGGLNIEAMKMMQVDKRFHLMEEEFRKMIANKNFDRLFMIMDKKVLIPNFIEMYDRIPDNDKYDVFKDLYVRSEYGFQSFPLEIIQDCFSKRKLSHEWNDRMKEFLKDAKLNDDGTLTVYRGENMDSAKSDDAFSWTLDKKTARFFADRFSKGAGRITSKTVKPEEVIDYLDDRGESEIILFPKKFGELKESYQTMNESEVYLIRGGGMTVRFIVQDDGSIRAVQQHANMGRVEWFMIDKDGNFSTKTNASLAFIIEKLDKMFNETIPQDMKELANLAKNETFLKWWKDVNHRFRGTIHGKKFGI